MGIHAFPSAPGGCASTWFLVCGGVGVASCISAPAGVRVGWLAASCSYSSGKQRTGLSSLLLCRDQFPLWGWVLKLLVWLGDSATLPTGLA